MPRGMTSAHPLLERDAAQARLGDLLGRTGAGAGAVALVEGPAGVGKTALLRSTQEEAARRGLRVLAATGSELEQDVPHGVVLQLFESEVVRTEAGRRDRLLSGAAALARPLLVDGGAPQESGEGGLRHALWWLCENLAAEQPLAIFVDDLQWVDPASLRTLQYVAARVRDAPIAVVAASRPGPASLLDGAVPIALDRLGPLAVGDLVRAAVPAADSALVEACAQASGGNPFLLHAVLEHLAELDAPGPADVDRAPDAVTRYVLADLERAERARPGARALAEMAAVLDGDAELRHAAALADLALEGAALAAEALAERGVLDAGDPLRFVHPLVRAAVVGSIPAPRRALSHLKAAERLDSDGARLGRIASHLLHASRDGDPWVVSLLAQAADHALAEGAPEVAVRNLRRALAEPPAADQRLGVLRALGRAEAAIGDPQATKRLGEALALAPDDAARIGVLEELGDVRFGVGDAPGAAARYDEAIALAPDDAVRRRLLSRYGTAAMLDARLAADAAGRIQELIAHPERDDVLEERVVVATLSVARTYACAPVDEIRALARRALADGRLVAEGTADATYIYAALGASTWAGDCDATIRDATAAIEDARRRGSLAGFANASNSRAAAYYWSGRVGEALADAQLALALSKQGWESFLPVVVLTACMAHADRGEAGEATSLAASLEAARWDGSAMEAFLLQARGVAAHASGATEEAYEAFTAAGRRFEPVSPNPIILDWRSRAALAAALAGRGDEAEELAAREVELARSFGAARAIGVALRAHGMVRGADGIGLLEEAVVALDGSSARLELARALVDLGAALRRAGRRAQAREPLARGRDLAAACGALGLERRAHEEQRAAGMRPRRAAITGIDALSPSERRVAELAAGGMSNRDIAQALFVTTKAVEWHLSNAYRKLAIRSRRELPAALGS